MANPSRPPAWKDYSTKSVCAGCGRKLTYEDNLWFVGGRSPAVYGFSCCADKAAAHAC